MKMKMQELLTSGVWEALTAKFGEYYGADSAIYIFLNSFDADLQLFALNDFADLLTFDFPEQYNNETIALMAFMHMGDAFKRIFDVLSTDYNPLENFLQMELSRKQEVLPQKSKVLKLQLRLVKLRGLERDSHTRMQRVLSL